MVTAPRYLLFEEREGYTLNVTVQPTAISGLVLFSCGGTRSTLYAGETFTFEADADSPVFAQISGDGSYSVVVKLEYVPQTMEE